MERNSSCYSDYPSFHCPEDCPGPESKFLDDKAGGEGYFVQICRDPAKIGNHTEGINWSGLGPDVLTFHQTDFPTDEEVYAATEIL